MSVGDVGSVRLGRPPRRIQHAVVDGKPSATLRQLRLFEFDLEETQRFGDKYRRYRDTVPRYLGLPRNWTRGENTEA